MSLKTKKQPKTIESLLKPRRIKIKVIGIGGGGGAIVSEMAKGLKGPSFLIADTDQRTFRHLCPKVRTFQFGRDLTEGFGTGLNLELGKRAAEKEEKKIEKIIQGQDLLIFVIALGGGVGSGAGPVFARVSRSQKNISLGIFTLPFNFEGERKMRVARETFKALRENLSGVLFLSNEKIFKFCDKKTPLKKAFSLLNQALVEYLKDLIEMLSQSGIINIDFADLRTILQGQGRMIYFGRVLAQGPARVEEAIKKVLSNSLWEKPSKIKRVLFNISGGKDLALKEVEEVAQKIAEFNQEAKIIFGISQNQKYNKKLKITLLMVGESLIEKKESQKEKRKIVLAKEKKKRKKKLSIGEKKVGQEKEEKIGIKKTKIRRSALEIKKAEKEAKEEELGLAREWEVPAFLRRKVK
ncbi:MAG: hypothetical protein QMC93_00270 [Patescibacteria group bacterium]|nr:hypothetical protein [Patescibacteria group bacterium]